MTVLRLAHVDIEGMTLDSKVKQIMAYIGNEWSQCLYNGMMNHPCCSFTGHSLLTWFRNVLLPGA